MENNRKRVIALGFFDGVRQGEPRRHGPAQLVHTSAAAQGLSDVMAKGADIGALGATDPQQMPSGIVIIDKPAGWTSMDVCAKLRGILKERRVGHGGTLDPPEPPGHGW